MKKNKQDVIKNKRSRSISLRCVPSLLLLSASENEKTIRLTLTKITQPSCYLVQHYYHVISIVLRVVNR